MVLEIVVEPLGYPRILVDDRVEVDWCEWEDLLVTILDTLDHLNTK